MKSTLKTPRAILILAVLFSPTACIFAQEAPGGAGGYRISAQHVGADPLKLDGILDEPAWQTATAVKLTQQSPVPGQPTPYETVVRILIAGNDLYFGFECADPEPDKIATHTERRDGDVSGDDTLAIVLDTYGDLRTGFFFETNAVGARIDGLINAVDSASLDWDGIWDVRTNRNEKGWSAEFVIPLQSLTFDSGLETWGVNFQRYVARDSVSLRWASPMLDAYIYDLSRAGAMSGINNLKQGRGLELSPYVTGRTFKEFQSGNRNFPGQPGLDVTWRMTPQMATVFTANTDFAETEVDSRQLNVTRFPLFFPERRAFFLEGANEYAFAIGLDGTNFIPFFSRRIGVFNGKLAPISGGVKLNGRAGRWNIGMLDVQTRDSQFAPGTNAFAGRASYDISDQWRLGAIVTHGDPNGVDSNTLVGFDNVWRTSSFHGNKNLLLGAWFVMSAGNIPSGNRSGWGARLDYPNDRWDCRFETFYYGDALDPALGFLLRPGTRQYAPSCTFKPRPSRDGSLSFVRQGFFGLSGERVDNFATGQTESWSVQTTPFDVQFDSGDRLTLTLTPHGEQLLQPFEISDGVILPVGKYQFNRFSFQAKSSSHRSWSVQTTTEFGDFYNGSLLQPSVNINWTSPEGTVQTALTVSENFGKLVQGNFVQRLWQLNLAYAFNPNLILTSFIQYESESESLGHNTRLRWTIKPGNDLFIVWNRGWKRPISSPTNLSLIPETDMVAIKLRWTFRI